MGEKEDSKREKGKDHGELNLGGDRMRWKLEMIATDENGKGREMRISYGKIRINGGVKTRRRIL